MVETPVLFITFCRPEYARQTWDGIKAAQPKTLYFYSNKGRLEKEGEIERNNEIRSYINEIDWECELHTWFRDTCVGVYESLHGAIDWLFNNEEMGIVLEEDCVPTNAFFSFEDQMLARYRDNKKIWMVGGSCYSESLNLEGSDFQFSHYSMIHGWGSWRDRWFSIDWTDSEINKIFSSEQSYNQLFTREEQRTHRRRLNHYRDFVMRTKCWDLVFFYTCIYNNFLTILPARHLINNVGIFGTHSNRRNDNPLYLRSSYFEGFYQIRKYPSEIIADMKYDYALNHMVFYGEMTLKSLFLNKLRRIKHFLTK